MQSIGVAIISCIVRLVASHLDALDGQSFSFDRSMTDTNPFLVVLHSDSSLTRQFPRPHSQLYHELTIRSISWTTIREYDDEVLTGAIVALGNVPQQVSLTEVGCVESITPVLRYPGPEPLLGANDSVLKRSSQQDSSRSSPLFGVHRLHAEGYRGRRVKIGIIGTGVDYTHPALGGVFGPKHKVIGGYDFVGDDYTGEPDSVPQPSKDPLDQCRGHGTMVAGIIGANPDNPHGITGVAYEASLNVYRIFGCTGGTSDVVLIDALLQAKIDGNDVVIVSTMPSDGWTMGSAMLAAARLAKAGIVVSIPVGSEGNHGFWRGWDDPEKLGIVSVGSARSTSDHEGVHMDQFSSFGPTNDLYMAPTLSALGTNILSTFPVPLGSYKTGSSTSFAASFFAGAAALWIQAHQETSGDVRTALDAFQNTVVPVQTGLRAHTLVESLTHQGSGMIHAYNAIHTTGTMQPAQLLLNDTVNFRGVRKISISNTGRRLVDYTLKNVPAETMPTIKGIESAINPSSLHPELATAAVQFSSSRVTVSSGSTQTIELRFHPPAGIDPMTFSVYSGHIQATGSDGSVLRSAYLGLAASMKQMHILDDTSTHFGVVLPYIKDKNGKQIGGRTTFTMIGDDKPVLVYRLVGCTRILRVDLIDSNAPPRMYARNINRRSTGRDQKGSPLRTFAKNDPRNSPNVGRKPGFKRPSEITVARPIFERTSVQRHPVRSRTGKQPYSTFTIKAFADGSAIPNGAYRVSLRALKITGNPDKHSDWEVWTSPEIVVRRAEPRRKTSRIWPLSCFPHCSRTGTRKNSNSKKQPIIRQVAPNIWTFSVPFRRFYLLPIGGRSTAIRLESGDVWLLASTPCDDATRKKLNEIGPVKYIIGADAVHHLYLKDYKAEYPDAKVIGVPALVRKKRGEVTFDGVYGLDPSGTKYGYEPEIQACYFSGFQNQDVAYLHVPSKTLIEADLLFNLPATEQYSNSRWSGKIPFIGKFGPRARLHKTFVWRAVRDRPSMAHDARVVANWDFDRIIPCHGNVIETGGNAAWREAYKWYLDPKTRL